MENFPVTVNKDKQVHHFEVGEYLHHDGENCKFKVFEQGVLVASFEPDTHNYLHVCKNPGNLAEEVLHLLADQIETHHPHHKYHSS
jgi:hypothetical protein